ncbi:MAG: AAA family ATPase, partial [Gemmatimonadota bacterium]
MYGADHPRDIVERALAPVLSDRLKAFPVVVLTGARQTGKSTFARRIDPQRTYLTLDDYGVLDQALNAPDTLLSRQGPLTLDEVQRAPDLLLGIKRVVDLDRTPGRFLLTGSADLRLMQSVSETLAGRAVYVTLSPLPRRVSGPSRGG